MDINRVVAILRREIRQWREPIVGHYKKDPFLVLISCLLSLRTKDETTSGACERLFAKAKTPPAILQLPVKTLERLIYPVGFYRTKAKTLKKVCALLMERYQCRVPNNIEELLGLPGVGRKTANLVVTLGFGQPGICVDTHVHRICNRLGYVRTQTPEDTEMALRRKLPPQYWIGINDLLVAYGQNLCVPVSPFCSRCKVRPYCRRAGVTVSR